MIALSWKVRLAIALAERLNAWIQKKREDKNAKELDAFADRLERFEAGEPFTADELRFAARTRCQCGYGLAYPLATPYGPGGAWRCSAQLRGIADRGEHDGPFPFAVYEIDSDDQPSAAGHSTRGGLPVPKPGRVIPETADGNA
jgi:hypothetical protein